jgi:Outer membrane protein beta-barrel domain
VRFIAGMLFFGVTALCQPTSFIAALGGISTLSADAATQLGPPNLAGLYKPENGGAANVAIGAHMNDWVSVQGNYVWNVNRITVTAIADSAFVEHERRATQHSGVADLLLYFRNRDSWARPYLSAGVGVVHLRDTNQGTVVGALATPPGVSATKALLRVAVGIDLMHSSRWGFRYSFSESISGNPYSAILIPRGSRNLANFQNLFGVVRYFGPR